MAAMLLLDAGNTRLKWQLRNKQHIIKSGVLIYPQLNALVTSCQPYWPPQQVFACSVANDAIKQQLIALLPTPIVWLSVTEQCAGVRNGYRQISQLGADRWAALLAAHQQGVGNALLIVNAGTALTVDALTVTGEFLGGIIVPGYQLMRKALDIGTAIPKDCQDVFALFPCSTGEAIYNGILAALSGAVLQMANRLSAHGNLTPNLLLTGGDAPLLLPLLKNCYSGQLTLVNDLVLTGLWVWIEHQECLS